MYLMARNTPLSMAPGLRHSFEQIFTDRKLALIDYLLSERMAPRFPRSGTQIVSDLQKTTCIEKFDDIRPILNVLKRLGVIELVDKSVPGRGLHQKDIIKTTSAGRAYLRKLPKEPIDRNANRGSRVNHHPPLPKRRYVKGQWVL